MSLENLAMEYGKSPNHKSLIVKQDTKQYRS